MSAMLAFALTLAPQTAPSPADLADAKCIGALSELSDKAGESDKSGIESGMLYFLGKIVGRSGTAAVMPAIEAAGKVLATDEAAIAVVAEQCAEELKRATDAM